MNAIQIISLIIPLIIIIAAIKLGRFKSNKLGSRRYAIKGTESVIIVYDKGIYLDKEKTELLFDDIASVGSNPFSSTETKERSVIGRAIVGGALAGSVGAIVGGMSGLKDKTTTHFSETVYIKTKSGMQYVFQTSEGASKLIAEANTKITANYNNTNHQSSIATNDAKQINQYNHKPIISQKVICCCGASNATYVTFCRVCGVKIDLTSMNIVKDGQIFEYQKCLNCNSLTPRFSRKNKFCSLCGVEHKVFSS